MGQISPEIAVRESGIGVSLIEFLTSIGPFVVLALLAYLAYTLLRGSNRTTPQLEDRLASVKPVGTAAQQQDLTETDLDDAASEAEPEQIATLEPSKEQQGAIVYPGFDLSLLTRHQKPKN